MYLLHAICPFIYVVLLWENRHVISQTTDSVTIESNVCSGSKVYWTVTVTETVLLRKVVKLVCKTTDGKDFCRNCTKIWTGGPEHSLLSLNGFPTENVRYLPTIGKNEFQVEIKNFNQKDLNRYYICSIGTSSCRRNLTMDMFVSVSEEDILEDEPTASFDNIDYSSKNSLIWLLIPFFLVLVFATLSCVYISEKGRLAKCCIFRDIFLLCSIKGALENSNNNQNTGSGVGERENTLRNSLVNVQNHDDENASCITGGKLQDTNTMNMSLVDSI